MNDPVTLQPSASNNAFYAASGGATPALTGSVVETVIGSILLPALPCGINGYMRGDATYSCSNNVNGKTPRIRLGGLAGTIISTTGSTASTANGRITVNMFMQGAPNAQYTFGNLYLGNGNAVANAGTPTAFDFSVPSTLVITAALANAGDTLQLLSYFFEFFRF